MGALARDMMPFCGPEFDGGPQLCDTCSFRTQKRGFRHCARMLTRSLPMQRLLRRAAPIARSGSPVVISGETGTGKEVLARGGFADVAVAGVLTVPTGNADELLGYH